MRCSITGSATPLTLLGAALAGLAPGAEQRGLPASVALSCLPNSTRAGCPAGLCTSAADSVEAQRPDAHTKASTRQHGAVVPEPKLP